MGNPDGSSPADTEPTPDRFPTLTGIEPANIMNDPTQTNPPHEDSPSDQVDSTSGGPDPSTAPLFDLDDPENPAPSHQENVTDGSHPASPTKDGLEELATRLPEDHPPKWAMNWRPSGDEEDQEIPGEHHPARHAGGSDDHSSAGSMDPETEAGDLETGMACQDASPEPGPAATSGPNNPSTPADPVGPGPTEPGPSEPGPIEPGPIEPSEAMDAELPATGAPEPSGSMRSTPAASRGGGQLGWIAAAIVLLAWLGVEIGTMSIDPATDNLDDATEVPLQAPLARPSPDPSREILLEEIAVLQNEVAILQDEVAVLRSEHGAAMLLREDHERIATELSRLERRRAVTLEQLMFLEASLERERQERAILASELDHAQRFLDETRVTD